MEKEKRKNEAAEKSADFSMFADASRFRQTMDLRDASLSECVESYMRNRLRENDRCDRHYRTILGYISSIEKEFGIRIQPVVVGEMFWAQLHRWLRARGLASTTVNNVCARLSAVLKWAAKYGAKLSSTVGECYVPESPARPKVSLTLDDVSRIQYFDVRAGIAEDCARRGARMRRESYVRTMERVRDEFVLSCYIGQRYSDARRVRPENFSNGMFSITQKKTGVRAVVDFKKMSMYPGVVRRLLEKYGYEAPYSGDIGNYNKKLHELFRIAGFDDDVTYEYKEDGAIKRKTFKRWQLISSHTARRTMITNNVQRGVNTEEIRRASGHKSESAFGRYIIWNND